MATELDKVFSGRAAMNWAFVHNWHISALEEVFHVRTSLSLSMQHHIYVLYWYVFVVN